MVSRGYYDPICSRVFLSDWNMMMRRTVDRSGRTCEGTFTPCYRHSSTTGDKQTNGREKSTEPANERKLTERRTNCFADISDGSWKWKTMNPTWILVTDGYVCGPKINCWPSERASGRITEPLDGWVYWLINWSLWRLTLPNETVDWLIGRLSVKTRT